MDDKELEVLRRHGFGVAYRMLGSVSEAEDVAQDACGTHAASAPAISNPPATRFVHLA